VRSHPKKPKVALPAFPFFPPYLLHNLIGNISGGSGHETDAGRFFSGGVRAPRETNRCSCSDWQFACSRPAGGTIDGTHELFLDG